MAQIIKEYSFTGAYSIEDKKAFHTGHLFYLDNHIIAGTCNEEDILTGQQTNKFLLGLHFPSKNRFAFLKINPADQLGISSMSYMRFTPYNKTIEGKVRWTFAECISSHLGSCIESLEDCIEHCYPEKADIENLDALSVRSLKQNYFSRRYLKTLRELSEENDQKGTMYFTALSS